MLSSCAFSTLFFFWALFITPTPRLAAQPVAEGHFPLFQHLKYYNDLFMYEKVLLIHRRRYSKNDLGELLSVRQILPLAQRLPTNYKIQKQQQQQQNLKLIRCCCCSVAGTKPLLSIPLDRILHRSHCGSASQLQYTVLFIHNCNVATR